MRTYLLIMGCVQTSASVLPANHVPIERLYVNEDYPIMNNSPVVVITAPPIPSYVKSALKKGHLDGRGKTERSTFLKRKPEVLNKSVNFDEQVQVKSRTPTPSKIWYEKASTTMPMRRYPRNDDDDHDYDEAPPMSSDEEEEQIESEPRIPTLGYPISLLPQNQANTFWYKNNSVGVVPSKNSMLDNEDPSLTNQQPSFDMNTYATENSFLPSANRIKVRRKLPDLGPPQTLIAPSYQSSIIPPNLTPVRTSSAVPVYKSLAQPLTVPSYQLPIQPPSVFPYQTSAQPPAVSPHQS
jgi:hypothetical protein